jgi:threonine aldolase
MIDLRSDTVTKPSAGMRQAIASAEVGDDTLDGDPTMERLEARTAELLGVESALFFPSGTMANQAAIWTLTRPGTEMYVHEDSHIANSELAGAAALAGVQARFMRGAPRVTRATLLAAVRDPSRDGTRATLLCIENTHAGSGGMVTPLEELRELALLGRSLGVSVFLDGARLWNASAATGTALSDFTACADLTMVSYSKGLGAPVGSALAGSRELIDRAWEARKRFGGGMRQSGVLAAAGLYGLECNLGRLPEDHENARRFAQIVSAVSDVRVVPPESNIVMVDLPPRLEARKVVNAAATQGVRVQAWTRTRLRAVTHLDVSCDEVERAAGIVRDVMS